MTTASPRSTATSGASVLFGAALAALVTGLGVTLIGAFAGGAPAAYGALAGTLLVVGVFFLGAGFVHIAAGLVPAASLLVALLTYTLQLLVLALVLVGLDRSGLLDDALDRRGWSRASSPGPWPGWWPRSSSPHGCGCRSTTCPRRRTRARPRSVQSGRRRVHDDRL